MTKYFFDTEFIEDGKTIDLISIGIISEDGHELYCVNREAKLHLASDWVYKNVMTHLPKYSDKAWMTKKEIVSAVLNFILETHWKNAKNDDNIEFWAYYADYDWVALCQLFGTMMDLPKGFPMFCMDLKQLSVMVGNPKHPEQKGTEHNALEDARWNKELYNFLMSK